MEVDDVDPVGGRRMRQLFMKDAEIARAYAFVAEVTRGACSVGQFADLVRVADRRGVWSFVGLQLWAIPFVLLSLDDFVPASGPEFRFVMGRGGGESCGAAWASMTNGQVRKHFTDSGKLFSIGSYIKLDVSKKVLNGIVPINRGRSPSEELRAVAATL